MSVSLPHLANYEQFLCSNSYLIVVWLRYIEVETCRWSTAFLDWAVITNDTLRSSKIIWIPKNSGKLNTLRPAFLPGLFWNIKWITKLIFTPMLIQSFTRSNDILDCIFGSYYSAKSTPFFSKDASWKALQKNCMKKSSLTDSDSFSHSQYEQLTW